MFEPVKCGDTHFPVVSWLPTHLSRQSVLTRIVRQGRVGRGGGSPENFMGSGSCVETGEDCTSGGHTGCILLICITLHHLAECIV